MYHIYLHSWNRLQDPPNRTSLLQICVCVGVTNICLLLVAQLLFWFTGISDAGEFLKIVIRDLGNKHIIQRYFMPL